jgi:hypothetical protein
MNIALPAVSWVGCIALEYKPEELISTLKLSLAVLRCVMEGSFVPNE